VTKFKHVAIAAQVGESIELALAEPLHCGVVHDIVERGLPEVA
jgi:hypothetical protein